MVALEPIPGPPRFAADTPGGALVLVNGAFRRELGLIRDEIQSGGTVIGARLRVNCLSVCANPHSHHQREDLGPFVGLSAQRPALAPVLAALRVEHASIARKLSDLERTLSNGTLDQETLRAEVERLTLELEQHLDNGERDLIPILNGEAT